MAKNNQKPTNIGKTKRSTDDLINDAIAQQNNWMENRRNFARRFLKTLNIFARPAPRNDAEIQTAATSARNSRNGLRAYWFPILCAIFVVFVAIWVLFVRANDTTTQVVVVVANYIISKLVIFKKDK